jgi:predicted ester cyclase
LHLFQVHTGPAFTQDRSWSNITERRPTGKSFTVDHSRIYRLEGDRIAEHWGVRDNLGMLRQLGHVG